MIKNPSYESMAISILSLHRQTWCSSITMIHPNQIILQWAGSPQALLVVYMLYTAATVLQVILQECWCFLLLAAVVRLHRTGAHACSLCVVVYPLLLHVTFFYMWIWWGRFFYTYQYLVGYFAFFFFQSTKANKRNDSSSVAASGRYQRLLRHQACMQRNDQSRRTFVKVS